MRNPVSSYLIMAIGVIALAVGVFFLTGGHHPLRADVAIGVGIVLVLAGIVAMFALKPKAVA